MIGMIAGDDSDADGDVKNIPTGLNEEVGGMLPLIFLVIFGGVLGAPLVVVFLNFWWLK